MIFVRIIFLTLYQTHYFTQDTEHIYDGSNFHWDTFIVSLTHNILITPLNPKFIPIIMTRTWNLRALAMPTNWLVQWGVSRDQVNVIRREKKKYGWLILEMENLPEVVNFMSLSHVFGKCIISLQNIIMA